LFNKSVWSKVGFICIQFAIIFTGTMFIKDAQSFVAGFLTYMVAELVWSMFKAQRSGE